MLGAMIQRLKRALGLSPAPLAVFVDSSTGSTVRYELFPRFISRTTIAPRDPDSDAGYFMSGFEADSGRIRETIGIADRERPAEENAQLDEFLRRVVTCVEEFQKAGIPAFAPMATPGINQIFFTKGQEFITKKKIPVFVRVGYYGPCSGGGDGRLPAGVRIRVTEDSEDYTTSTSCELLEPFYSDLEKSLVPKDELIEELYAGYGLSIDSDVVQDHCKPVEPEAESHGESGRSGV